MPAFFLRHGPATGGLALLALLTLSACASPAPTPHVSGSTSAPRGGSPTGHSCAEVYAVGQHITEIRSCTVNKKPVSVGSYTCIGPERLGSLDLSAGLSRTVWFVVPGVVTAAAVPLKSDPAYITAFTKCTGKAP